MRSKWLFLLIGVVSLTAVLYAQEAAVFNRGINAVRGDITTSTGSLVVGSGSSGGVRVMGATGDIALKESRTTLTNAQVLALNTTPITVVSAPTAGSFVDVLGGYIIFDYTGAYTVGGSDDLALYYTSRVAGNRASNTIETTGLLDQTADTVMKFDATPNDTDPNRAAVVAIENTSGVAFGGGNASNSVVVVVFYRVIASGL